MQGHVVKLGDKLESGLAKYAVHVEVEPGIGAIGIGPITGSITRAWVEYGGKEVTEVPEGENFEVKVSYTASNPGFFPSPITRGWSTAATVISTDRVVKGRNPELQLSSYVSDTMPVSLGPMPAYDITLRVKLWGIQAVWGEPLVPDYPPETEW